MTPPPSTPVGPLSGASPGTTVAALAALALAWGAPGAAAQDHEDPLVPSGTLRIWIEPGLERWDSRFGRRTEEGEFVEEEEPLGFDLTGPRLGTRRIPSLAPLESAIADALDDPGYLLDLGASRFHRTGERSVLPIRLDLGVTDWLTVGVNVPFVRTIGEAEFALLGGGNVGLSPRREDPASVDAFLSDLARARSDVAARAAEICADRGESDPECREARTLEAEIASLAASLEATYEAGPLFPTATSVAGQALLGRLATLEARAASLGVGTVPGALPFASGPLATSDFQDLLEDPELGVLGDPLRTARRIWWIGDVEVSAAVRLLESPAGRDPAGRAEGLAYRVGGGLLLRLPTGQEDFASNFVDVGTGDGQLDVEGRLFTTLGWGERVSLWADARYGVQAARTIRRRIAPPEVVLAPAATETEVEWTPGDYWALEVAPRVHLGQAVALSLRYSFRHEGEDAYEAADAAPADVSLLEIETALTRHMLGFGASYSTLAAAREGRYRVPLEARVRFLTSVAGSGGRTPRLTSVEGGLRVYWRLWGG